MSSAPKVSVIMSFLNAERFIQEAIESVLAQTYDSWELLLVDDGSTDGSTNIARRYAEQYHGKLRYFEHEGHSNRGLSASHNFGIQQARGEYIAFLDSDDVYLSHNLAHQTTILDARPDVVMVYSQSLYWYSWSGEDEDRKRDYIPRSGLKNGAIVKPPMFLPLFLQAKIGVPCPCSIIVRRSLLDRVGAFEAAFRYIYTDQVFYTKISLAGSIIFTDACLAKYRQHPASSVAVVKSTGQTIDARVKFLRWVEQYLVEQQVSDARVWRALRREYWNARHPRMYDVLSRVDITTRRARRRLYHALVTRLVLRRSGW
jgi:glycosyltransferase involved in cell wall biosynthesis